jgi:hypothetical protein
MDWLARFLTGVWAQMNAQFSGYAFEAVFIWTPLWCVAVVLIVLWHNRHSARDREAFRERNHWREGSNDAGN